jgi:phenylpropionate dioxygenase-like ring-hydroxylating dioxygenase large terminal subunit
MNTSFLAARASRVALFCLLALGAYTEAQACPCGCVRVPVDNLLDRPAAAASPFTFDVRYDYVDQNRRNNDAHAHFFAVHRNITSTLETNLGGQVWSLAIPRVDRTIRTNIVPTMANPNPVNTSQDVNGLGDIALSTRFKWSDYTVIAGVKLPTGEDDLTLNVSRRYLQPGTGSTDLMLALRREYSADADHPWFFWQVGAQGAVAYDANFRPGTTLTGTLGARYDWTESLKFSLQTTAIRQFRDKNTMNAAGFTAYAEDLESAAFSTHIAAGLTYQLGAKTSAYLFYSTPMKNNNMSDRPNGSQVNPVHSSEIWSLGLSHSF